MRITLCVSMLAATSLASAEPCPTSATSGAVKRTPEEIATAKSLFTKGLSLQSAGKIDESCKMFESAFHLDPALGIRFNVAECHELRGRLVEAHALFSGAVDEATRNNDPRAEYAKQRLTALESKLVRVTVRPAEELTGQAIQVAGCSVATADLSSPRIVKPGTIVVEATAPGRKPLKVEKTGTPGQELVIELPALTPYGNPEEERKAKEAEALAAMERRKTAQLAIQREREVASQYDRHPARKWTIVTGALGAAALIGGSVFAVRTRSAQSAFDDAGCGDPNTQIDVTVFDECTRLRDRGQRESLLANALLTGGGVVLAASVIVFAIDPGNVERPRATIAASPSSINLLVRW